MIVANSIDSNHQHKQNNLHFLITFHDGLLLCRLQFDWFLSCDKKSQISGSGCRRTS